MSVGIASLNPRLLSAISPRLSNLETLVVTLATSIVHVDFVAQADRMSSHSRWALPVLDEWKTGASC